MMPNVVPYFSVCRPYRKTTTVCEVMLSPGRVLRLWQIHIQADTYIHNLYAAS